VIVEGYKKDSLNIDEDSEANILMRRMTVIQNEKEKA